MLKIVSYSSAIFFAMWFSTGPALADNSPTIDQVYQAANSGRLGDAQSMMETVLKDHPNSAKAHFVEAELFARQGQLANAENELNTAQKLQPDLSFAKPAAVQNLRNQIFASHSVNQSSSGNYQAPSENSFPWGMLLLGLGSIAVIVLIMRAMNSRNASTFPSNYQPGMPNGAPSPMPMQPYGGGMGPMGSSGSGIGGGIMGGLATGAAVGVGMVAGEALAHHFMDGGRNDSSNASPVADTWGNSSNNDMGGSDFGLADNSTWNDSSNVADSGSDVGGGDWT